ncbi:MAG: tRNA1(Val) (adenine(37)-N6)-methyltransferase [Clostridia bacterium]|nr:tRNA1(Val) (adenine(37)-N6)-methyltransferase [Clostridia bacterium]
MREKIVIKADETVDDLLINNLRLIQKQKGFRFTLDSVLVAHFATVKTGDRIVDLGTGTGVIPLILSTRASKVKITGIELQEDLAEMAVRSVQLNNLAEVIQIIQGDFRGVHLELGGGIFNLVTANPPYWSPQEGEVSPAKSRAVSRHEITGSLQDVVECAGKLLNYQGRFALIYPVDKLLTLFELLRQAHLEPRKIRFIHSFRERPARLFLLEARKNAPAELKVLPPLIIYEKPGQYSAEILSWYGKEVVNLGGK